MPKGESDNNPRVFFDITCEHHVYHSKLYCIDATSLRCFSVSVRPCALCFPRFICVGCPLCAAGKQSLGRIVIVLRKDVCPKTAENFRCARGQWPFPVPCYWLSSPF